MTIRPVILSGGSGTRLWPLSRALYPKQLLPLVSERTMLQETIARVAGGPFASPIVICNEEHRFIVAEQLRAAGAEDAAIVLEPVGRNTAPAAAVAALLARADDPDALVLLLPSDHLVTRPDAFVEAVGRASLAAAKGYFATFGIAPDRPETGYGYIRAGAAIDDAEGCFAVQQFTEKPDAETAEGFLADGGYTWNSGMFLLPAGAFLAELAVLQPEILAAAEAAVAGIARDLDFHRLDRRAFESAPADSIDYAVMEKTDKAAVVPVDLGWSDVGSWSSLWEIADKDARGNAVIGDVVHEDVEGSYLRTEGPLLAAAGLRDVVVVATRDAVVVAHRNEAQRVRELVRRLDIEGREESLQHLRVYRPWGWFQAVDAGDGFQVKRLCVYPGRRLSLQYHERRAEHWIVVSGEALITNGDAVVTLGPNQSTYIPVGNRHRLENPGDEDLHLIEVQSGDYLGEDDIVRLEDDFARDK